MAVSQPGRKVLVMGLVSTALVTWRELKEGNVPPPPHAYAGVAIVYGFDSVLAELNGDLAVYFGAAWTLLIAYSTYGAIRGLQPVATRQPRSSGKAKPTKPKAGGGGKAGGLGRTRAPQPALRAPTGPAPVRARRASRTPAEKLPPRPRPPHRRGLPSHRQPIVTRKG